MMKVTMKDNEIKCPACGEAIPDDSRYCDMCGVELLECVNCGALGVDNFCADCGKPMVSRKAGSAVGEKTDTGSRPDYIEEPTVTDKTIGCPDSVDKTIGGRRKRTVLKARKGNIVLVPEDEAVIGRQKDTRYSELLEDCSLISRRHGKFMKRGRDWYIVDFGSTNGTLVNDVELEPDKPVRFSPGDVVDIGTYIFDVVEQ